MLKAAIVLALAASVLQNQPPRPTIRARADLVQVDAVVVDRDGRHVRGLTAADFVVRDRRQPQVIASFDEIAHVRPPARERAPGLRAPRDVGSNQIPSADRLVVMVVDDLHIYKDRTDRAKEIARRAIDELGRSASMAVLFTSGDHSTRVTDDTGALSAAVDSLRGRQSWRRPHAAVDRQRTGHNDADMSAEQQLAVVGRAQEASLQEFFDNLTQYKLLQDAARLLRTNDSRRKAFVLISEGIGKELSGLFEAMAPPGEAPDGGGQAFASGGLGGLLSQRPSPYHDDALLEMMESLRRANVTTYAFDPRGKIESKDLARECFPAPRAGVDPCSEGMTEWVSPVRQAQRGLEIMAEASGGFAITNSDDFAAGLDRILGDLDHYYMLGFYPSNPSGKGYRPLEVAVPGHPDWKVRYRRGYMPERGRDTRGEKNTSEMIALSSGILPRGDLPLKLSAIPRPGQKSSARIALVLEVAVPRVDVEEHDGRVRDTLKYELLVVDEKKAKVRSVGGREGRLTLSPRELGRTPPDVVSYQVAETIDLAPGQYEVRWSATSAKLAKGGSVYLPVTVPDFNGSGPALGGIAVSYLEGARVPGAPVLDRLAVRRTQVTAPETASAVLPIAPTLDREFGASDTLRVYAEGTVHDGARATVAVEILDRAGRVVASPSPSFTTGEIVKVVGDVPLAGLSPGPHVLRMTVTSGSRSARREVPFVVR
jgi:VWFA-related protein